VKPNIGHLEAGAGVMGLIKVLLQLDRGTLLPSITSSEPSPHIPFADTPFSVQRTLAPWNRARAVADGVPVELPRRAGLNSFGVGGANAHILVEEAPAPVPAPHAAAALDRAAHC
jgi:acyl transferase domain-containing protein